MQQAQPNNTSTPPAASGLSLDDVYYTLFRHKWKILICWAAGLIGATVLYFVRPPVYTSDAKLLVRYVVNVTSIAPDGAERATSADSQGNNIISAEQEILTSLDLALQVADLVGPEKILAIHGGGSNRNAAAGVICGGLTTDVPRKGSVIVVTFSHPDRSIVQPVLRTLVDVYLQRHVEIHQGGLDGYFTRQADEIRSRLARTEDELQRLKSEANVVSIEDSKKAFVLAIAKIQEDLLRAQADLAGQKSTLDTLTGNSGVSTNDGATGITVPADISEHYREICLSLASLHKQRREKLVDWKEEHPQVKRLQELILTAETQKKELEREHPTLTALVPATAIGAANSSDDTAIVRRQVNSLGAKITELQAQLERTRTEADRVVKAEPAITQLERQRDMDRAKYNFYVNGMDQSHDGKRGDGKVANISSIQSPSPPVRDSKKLLKPLGAVLAAGIVGGIALAFLIDLIFDRSVKRASDIEKRINLRPFLSIPDWRQNGSRSKRRHKRHEAQIPAVQASSMDGTITLPMRVESAPWEPEHALTRHFEALRDRLITYFEVRNMTHKPKLVGVTSCNSGAGVTTMAAGLAASLSETGDGKVLLVDMKVDDGAAYPFKGGKPDCALSELLESETPGAALLQERLYRASAGVKADELPRVLPKRFANLVPKLKGSDFDYIILDLPPVSETSVTPRLARFMDIVLVVVESETTGQAALKDAFNLLQEAGVGTAAVLNKTHNYIPKALGHQT